MKRYLSIFILCTSSLLMGQNISVQADATTGVIWRPSAFIAGNDLLTATAAGAAYQPLHANLTAIAGLSGAADQLFYFTGTTTVAATTFTAVARQLLDDATAADMRTTLGLGTLATQSGTFSGTSSGTNTGDQTISITGDVTAAGSTGSLTATVTKINGVSLGGLATGILKNTTSTGVPSIAVAGDFPTLNQNTTGNAATVTTNANLTGHVTSVGNAAVLGSFTVAQLNTAISDADVATGGGTATGTNTGDQTTITGNAGTATALQTARTIGNISFNGTANIVPETTAIVDSTDSTSFVLVVDSATGNLQAKTDAGITYNSTTGVLAATGFAGPLTGNVTGSITGNAATVTTNANLTGHVTSVGNAAVLGSFTVAQLNTAISDADVATGGGTATGTNTGDQTTITGNAGTATALQTARTIGNVSFNGTANIVPETTAVVDSTDSTSFVLVVDSATGNLQAKTDTGITYNSVSGGLTLTGPITAGSGSEFKNTWIKSGNSAGIKLGADDSSTNLTDATMKGANVSMPHYSNSTEEDVTLFRLTSSSGSNTLSIGGANANQNALTSINFYTAATNTTTSGTRRGGFNSAGVFDVTATTSSVSTTSGAGVFGGGLGVAENINAGGYITAAGAITAGTSYTLTSASPIKLWWGADYGLLDNMFLGYTCGDSLTSAGRFNLGIGSGALGDLTSGDNNTVIGYLAGTSITTAGDSTLFGYRSGYQATGAGNTFVGSQSFMSATTGASNTGFGAAAMGSLTSGGTNTALGYLAGFGYTTQGGGVFLGYAAGQYSTAGNEFIVNNQDRTDAAGDQTKSLLYGTFNASAAAQTLVANAQLSSSVSLGYSAGAGGTQTQTTSRTTGVTLDKICGSITLVSAAGSTSWQSFTVTNAAVAANDVVIVSQKSGTDKYMIHVTAVAAGSFVITYATTGGTTTEQPVFNFAVIKAVTS